MPLKRYEIYLSLKYIQMLLIKKKAKTLKQNIICYKCCIYQHSKTNIYDLMTLEN